MTLDQFFGIHPTCDVPSNQIGRWFALLVPLLEEVPDLEITPELRDRINGYLMPVRHELILNVVRALSEQGAVLSDIPIAPGPLDEKQVRAAGWLMVREAARVVLDRADRCYRLEASEAMFDALRAVRQVRADQGKEFPGPADSDRQMAMEPAELTLAGYQDALQGG